MVARIRELRAQLEGETAVAAALATVHCKQTHRPMPPRARDQLRRLELLRLNSFRAKQPLMRVCVDAQTLSAKSSPAGPASPSARWFKDEIATVLELEQHLGRRVIGQIHALAAISAAHPHLPRRASTIPASPSVSSCWSGPAASARPKPRWLSPISSTAASAISSPSTCRNSRKRTRSPP